MPPLSIAMPRPPSLVGVFRRDGDDFDAQFIHHDHPHKGYIWVMQKFKR